MPAVNLVLLVVEAVIYFTVMVTFLHFRHRLGLGVFLTALGVMHFLETYLAAVFYVQLPFGLASPGSSVLFAGKLMMILLLYLKEDAATVRQPIYGLFLGNLLTVCIAWVVQLHDTVAVMPGSVADLAFLRQMGGLMLWGTTLLYLNSLGIILVYERLGRLLQRWTVLRLMISGMLVLTFDQIGFFAVLHYVMGAPAAVFWDGWTAKMLAATLYAGLFALYQSYGRGGVTPVTDRPIGDVFNDLTFRERYEDLLARAGLDGLTGIFDRTRLELDGPQLVAAALGKGETISVIIADTDHFKEVNDRFGHLQGDAVLKAIANELRDTMRKHDLLFRFGGEEFVVLAPRTTHDEAVQLCERLRQRIAGTVSTPEDGIVTISLGVATAHADGGDFNALLTMADERLYKAKKDGRNCTFGQAGRV